MEDHYAIKNRLEDLNDGGDSATTTTSFFGVFDGHRGDRCAKFLAAELPAQIAASPYFANDVRTRKTTKHAHDLFRFLSARPRGKNARVKHRSPVGGGHADMS